MLSNFRRIKGYQPNLPSVLVVLNDDLVNSAWWLILVFHTGLPIFWQLGLMWSRGSLQIPCYCNCSSANQIHGPSTDLLYVWTIWHFTFSHFDLQVNQLWLNFWSTKCRCGSRISARGVVKGSLSYVTVKMLRISLFRKCNVKLKIETYAPLECINTRVFGNCLESQFIKLFMKWKSLSVVDPERRRIGCNHLLFDKSSPRPTPKCGNAEKKRNKKKWEQGGDESTALTLNLSLGSINTLPTFFNHNIIN